MYAVSVDGILYGFHHSPLGVLEGNVHCVSWRAPCPRGVRLYEQRDGEWVPVRWPGHMWWTRFLLTGHAILCGTRHEDSGHVRATSRFLRWWFRGTPHAARAAFFADPDVRRVCRELRRAMPAARGRFGMAQGLLRVWAAVRTSHPLVLRPCPESHGELAYTESYTVRMTRDLVAQLEADTPACTTVAHACEVQTFATLLLRGGLPTVGTPPAADRSGCRFEDAIAIGPARQSAFLAPDLLGAPILQGASVRRHRSIGCSILEFARRQYITSTGLESLWQDFAVALCTLCRHCRVILLDAPMDVRRVHHVAVGGSRSVRWLADSSATATNLCEEVGVPVDTAGYYTKNRGEATARIIVVDGVQRLGLRQQTDLLRRLADRSPQVVLLAGDTAGRVYHRALDGWTLCCHAGRSRRRGGGTQNQNVVTEVGRGLVVWVHQPAPEEAPPAWHECRGVSDTVPADGRRWLCAPVSNGQLVAWVCQTVAIPAATMTVVNGTSPRDRTLFTGRGSPLDNVCLCDQSPAHHGQEVRCILSIPNRSVRFGEVYRILDWETGDRTVRLEHVRTGTALAVTAITPAIASTDEGGGGRPANSRGRAARPDWAPYTSRATATTPSGPCSSCSTTPPPSATGTHCTPPWGWASRATSPWWPTRPHWPSRRSACGRF